MIIKDGKRKQFLVHLQVPEFLCNIHLKKSVELKRNGGFVSSYIQFMNKFGLGKALFTNAWKANYIKAESSNICQ